MKSENKSFVTDIDGNKYPIIRIGSQLWTGTNLRVTHFLNGDPIEECRDAEAYALAGQKGEPAWCYYDNKIENGEIYGALYNWFAAHDPRGIAPEGWRIPTEEDWAVLESYSQLNAQPSALLK
ncbi:FISUMP domain-containing protein, partial [Flagellimonas marinaquae]